ncbi:MAG: SAM-dependent methyltransferase [Clostridia bacterium]|nr:SAM-dependent methyltransferase [Clostridia bacterium]
MIRLTPRLQAVADCVEAGNVIADIGTDHAYIPAYLIENGIIPSAYACDVRQGPLENARKTARRYEIDGIRFVLSDGLQALECEQEEFSYIVIAGMGGELIRDILERSPWCHNPRYTFVLQPMTRARVLREWLYQNGFEILQESIAKEDNKLYNIMKVRFSAHSKSLTEAEAYLGFATESEYFHFHKQAQLKRLQKVYDSLQNKKDSEAQRQKISELMKEIEVYK